MPHDSSFYQEAYHIAVEHSVQGILIFQDQRLVFANPAAARALGFQLEELTDLPIEKVLEKIYPEDRRLVEQIYGNYRDGFPGLRKHEFRLSRAAGEVRWLEAAINRVELSGKPALQITCTDITERRLVERALWESEELYRSTIDSVRDCIHVADLDLKIQYVNEPFQLWAKQLNVDLSLMASQQLFEFFSFLGKEFLTDFSTVIETGKAKITEETLVNKDHTYLLEVQRIPVMEGKRVRQVVTVLRDITEQRRAEKLRQALYQISEAANSANSLEGLYPRVHQVIEDLIAAKNLFIALYNETTQEIHFPYHVDEYDERPEPRKLAHGLTDWVIREAQPLLINREILLHWENEEKITFLGKPSECWLGIPLKTLEHHIIGVLAVQSYDANIFYTPEDEKLLSFVSEQIAMAIDRKTSEDGLRASEENYRSLFDHVPVGLYRATPAGLFLDGNPALVNILGYPSRQALTGKSLQGHYQSAAEYEAFRVLLETSGALQNYEIQAVRCDGRLIWVNHQANVVRDETGSILRYEGSMEDVTERKRSQAALQQANDTLQRSVLALEQHNREASLMSEMSDLLQSCQTSDEAFTVIGEFLPRLFPHTPGALFMCNLSGRRVDGQVRWGQIDTLFNFVMDDCWALRRGRPHLVEQEDTRLRCAHMGQPGPESGGYCCVPLIAQGETLGLLNIQGLSSAGAEEQRRLAGVVSERLALSLANLRLRQTLRLQSIRDSLTGLFNRRYMEETLERELRRAVRHRGLVGVVMLDIDHFKLFNDNYGHDAGDVLLRELGKQLLAGVRGDDVACRYGGEEFVLILPGAGLEATCRRAEQIRLAIEEMQVNYRGTALQITISVGVAVFPEHAVTDTGILRAADAALLRAKELGRNQVVSFVSLPNHKSLSVE